MTSHIHARAKEIFHEAAERPRGERQDFLREVCGDDPDLRREVETLLEHHDPKSVVGQRAEGAKRRPSRKPVLRPRWTSLPADGSRPFSLRGRTWALLALVFLLALGLWSRQRVERAQLRARGDELQVLLDANVAALDRWVEEQKIKARQFAQDPRIVPHVEELLEIAEGGEDTAEALKGAPARDALLELWKPIGSRFAHAGCGLTNVRGMDIFDETEATTGVFMSPLAMSFNARVLAGETVFTRPLRSSEVVRESTPFETGSMYTFVGAPVRDAAGRAVAVFWVPFAADGPFSDILETAQIGQTGETYAFDDRGLMLSRSRFTEELRDLGLLPPDDDPGRAWDRSTQLNLSVRDPGVDLREASLALDLDTRPLTPLAATAIASRKKADPAAHRGVLIEPYRGYRGVEVIGAWRWHEGYDFALATEMEVDEALGPLHHFDVVFVVLFGLLIVFMGATLVSTLSTLRLRRRVGRLESLGQYTLLAPLAEGGMGKVYRAEHAMLKRPTAVKILSEDFQSEDGVARFEREVRLASQLTHPNTIDIYDYGRTPEGVFYYAMELVEGPTLAELVAKDGPLPPSRVVHILRQVCLSLGEAHGRGLVHRDVKPANIMLCERGGVRDVVKVLDFGLVKDVEKPHTRDLTVPTQAGGTPLYMAPERVTDPQTVDARSDIYAVGAVAYLLLTGRPIFTSVSDVDLMWKVVNAPPEAMGDPAAPPPELEALVLRCLAKDPAERPQDVCELLIELDAIPGLAPWTQADARRPTPSGV